MNADEPQQILDRLHESQQIGEPDLPAGRCEECQSEAPNRYRLGRFALCRSCRTQRARVAAIVAGFPQPTKPDLLADLTAQLDEALDWDPPDF